MPVLGAETAGNSAQQGVVVHILLVEDVDEIGSPRNVDAFVAWRYRPYRRPCHAATLATTFSVSDPGQSISLDFL